MLIDTHTHLQLVNYNKDREAVIQRALDAGVQEMLNISFNLPSSKACVNLVQKYPFMKATVGIHPHEAKEFDLNSLLELKTLASSKQVIAIGEIGLDFYRDLSPEKIQREVFQKQLELAKEMDLPVIIHTRDAYFDLLKIMKEEEIERGVLHCFAGNAENVKKGIDMGLYFGIGGMITFKNTNLPALLKKIPLDNLLLETDCPFLTPRPHKGRNEPSYLTTICKKISEILEVPYEEVAKRTSKNARSLFGL